MSPSNWSFSADAIAEAGLNHRKVSMKSIWTVVGEHNRGVADRMSTRNPNERPKQTHPDNVIL